MHSAKEQRLKGLVKQAVERKDNCTARAFALLRGTLILVLTGTVPSPGNVLKGLEASPQKYLHAHTDCCNIPKKRRNRTSLVL